MSLKMCQGRKRAIWTVMTLVLGLLLFVTAAASSAKVQLRLLTWESTGTEAESRLQVIKLFEKARPDIDVVVESLPYNQYYKVLETRMAGGTAPDVFRATGEYFGRYAQANQALDLSPYLEPGYARDWVPAFWEFSEYRDQIVGLYTDTGTIATAYNKDYLTQIGVQAPTKIENAWTWKEFKNIGKKLQAGTQAKYGFTHELRSPRAWVSHLFQSGVGPLTSDLSRSTWDSPEAIEALTWSRAVIAEGLEPPGAVWKRTDSETDLFKLGVTGLAVIGQWMIPYLQENATNINWGVTYLKQHRAASADMGGAGYAAWSKTKHPKEAAELVKWFGTPEMMAKISADGFLLPTRKSALGLEINYPYRQKEMAIFAQQLEMTPQLMAKTFKLPEWPKMSTLIDEYVGMAVLGQMPVEAAAKKLAQEYNRLIRAK